MSRTQILCCVRGQSGKHTMCSRFTLQPEGKTLAETEIQDFTSNRHKKTKGILIFYRFLVQNYYLSLLIHTP